ncbi:DNA polymerase I [Piscirickettsia litoralis]|uniref:DNA polymerase I n=1 Tax=Piscirickettsia litoralis TaxID=1891921 RepID=A0ABX3A2L9_9GAMM|nr:DNA polymerase I [Piscirickettsia litoralis]ODN43078.1 DNA polymerase I [Piscirickettsia litoralis]
MPKKIILVDGSSYLFRAFYALPSLTNKQGEPTGAIYGVINMIRKLNDDFPDHHPVIIFDAKGKTFRHDMYPEYKANRGSMPDELAAQIKPLHEIIVAMGLPLIAIEGVEADDVIGTLAKIAEQKNISVLISTGDKDMAQLVNDNINLVDTMKGNQTDYKGVEEKFGVKPEQIIDYLSLIGDTSDNVPGIPGVGPKTAEKWLAQYNTVENLVENAENIKGKVGERLRENLKQLTLAQKLVTIDCQVKLPNSFEELISHTEKNQELLSEYFSRFEFKRWLENINTNIAPISDSDSKTKEINKDNSANYHTILTKSQLNDCIKRLKQAEVFAIDTETTSLDSMQANIVGLSVSTGTDYSVYIPLAHDYLDAPDQLDLEETLLKLKPILEDPKQIKVGQHIKYDMNVLSQYDIDLQGVQFDTMLESYVINSTATRHNLDALALRYLNHETIHFEDIAGKGKKQLTFNQINIDQASPYAAEDADITLQLHNKLWPKIKDEKDLTNIYLNKEQPLIKVLAKMEQTGVLVDSDKLSQQSKAVTQRINEIAEDVYAIADSTFNLSSTKQLQEILFDKLNLPIIKKTPKGKPSTAEDVLQELALEYELPKLILEHRSLSKLKSTYLDKLPLQVNPKTGRIHTSYHQAVTATGRLSSSDPNLQNIPIRTEEGRRIRDAFIAPAGYQLIAADYSQIELRIMAHLSEDKNLIHAFENDLDIHSATASEVFSVAINDVTSEQRRRAKAVNFGLIYGMSAFGLAKQLGVERNEAQDYIDIYFARYPKVAEYMDNIREQAKTNGYVTTVCGRRLYLPEINARNAMRRKAAERTAINAPMQGTAADIIKQAMINIHHWLQQTSLDVKMLMQVHDELIFEVAEKDIVETKKEIKNKMENAIKLSVPLIVEAGHGNTWGEAH